MHISSNQNSTDSCLCAHCFVSVWAETNRSQNKIVSTSICQSVWQRFDNRNIAAMKSTDYPWISRGARGDAAERNDDTLRQYADSCSYPPLSLCCHPSHGAHEFYFQFSNNTVSVSLLQITAPGRRPRSWSAGHKPHCTDNTTYIVFVHLFLFAFAQTAALWCGPNAMG